MIKENGIPHRMLFQIHEMMGELTIGQLKDMKDQMGSGDECQNEGGEGLHG